MDYVTYWLWIGFVLAVLGDGVNMYREWKTNTPKPETRFGLADTVFIMILWPVVLWVAFVEARKELRRG